MNRVFFIIIISFFIANEQVEYFGGWPINPNKDAIEDPGLDMNCESDLKDARCNCVSDEECDSGICFSSPRAGRYCLQGPGTMFPRFKLIDQFGEEIDFYDFAGHGKLIVIEISTAWCSPCQKLAAWLSDKDTSITNHKWWKKEYNVIRDLVINKEIFFINVQTQDVYRSPSSLESLEDWYNMYPDLNIALLADSDYHLRDWVRASGYPTIIVLNDKMEIAQFALRGWHDAFNFISNINQDIESEPVKKIDE